MQQRSRWNHAIPIGDPILLKIDTLKKKTNVFVSKVERGRKSKLTSVGNLALERGGFV